MIVGELEGAEAGHHVKGPAGPGQRLEVTHVQVRLWGAAGGDLDQFGGGINTCHARTALGGQVHETAGAASTVQHGHPWSDVRGGQDVLVHPGSPALRPLPRVGPIPGTGAEQRTPQRSRALTIPHVPTLCPAPAPG